MADRSVTIDNLVKTYVDDFGNPTFTAVKGINLDIKDGEFMVLVGPSGCGKSTTLRMIAGLEDITSGTIKIGGRVVNDVKPKDRGIAMVFQNYALYPHMTIFDNMAFGLKLAKKDKKYIKETVERTAKALGLDHLLNRKPQALSGGQRQRVALGRAIVREPKVFLFDEPLSNLDAKMRVQMRAEISRLHSALDATMVYVTHDQVEAMTMGDRICVMRDGNVMQVADPLTLYRQPQNLFVAGFIGSPPMNLLRGTVRRGDGGLMFVEEGEPNPLAIPLKEHLEKLSGRYEDKKVVFGIRPEHLSEFAADPMHVPLTATVEIAEPMGSESLVYLRSASGPVVARIQGEQMFQRGDEVAINVNLNKAQLFDATTDEAIR